MGMVSEGSLGQKGFITEDFKGARSLPVTKCARLATDRMKAHFKETKLKAKQGEPVVWMQAGGPQEICHAMGIPVFFPIHYSALIAAKQASPYYLGVQNSHGYFRDLCRYCGLALGSIWDENPDNAPWGGVPKPTAIVIPAFDDIIVKIYELFARHYNVPLFVIDRTMWSNFPDRFWENPEIESWRLRRETEEYQELVRFLETITGRTMNPTILRETVDRSNEQFGYFVKAMNLVAMTSPSPINTADHISNLVCTNYFRGTEWGLAHAKQFYEEVCERIMIKQAACKNERIRLGWVGAAPWFSPGFLNAFEEKYGAVFTWLGYITCLESFVRLNYADPLETLASRYLNYIAYIQQYPPTGCHYFLFQAKKYQLDGMVFLAAESCKAFTAGIKFIQRELQAGGIPTTELSADIVDAREWDEVKATARISDWIETLAK